MSEKIKEHLIRFAITIIAPVIVGLGSSYWYTTRTLVNLEAKVGAVEMQAQELKPKVDKLEKQLPPLEVQILRHEKALEKDFSRHEQTVGEIVHKTEDQEKRLTRLEALYSHTQALLNEIRADLKTILRDMRK